MSARATALILFATLIGCSPEPAPVQAPEPVRSSILLVTLDTTRADRMGFESEEVDTPALELLAARGVRFSQAWTTAPMTLPAHSSILTGLYPSQHGIRENARTLGEDQPLLAERLREVGYSTAAFVSGYPLNRRFGLSRGFDHYDDHLEKGRVERSAGETTQRALEFLERSADGPHFLWVHYFDPHEPYAPPEPFLSRYPSSPYAGEIAYMDQELGRLIEGFERRTRERGSRILVVGDHGEGLGEHGEAQHGSLLYRGVMRVPLIVAGKGIPSGHIEEPVSIRRVFPTILGWAGLESSYDLLAPEPEVVMAEALKPYLQYGWQPQVMAIRGSMKVIRSGSMELYDLRTDPAEVDDLSERVKPDRELVEAIRSYGLLPSSESDSGDNLEAEARLKLASLGYVGWESPAPVREGAPDPRDMAYLFRQLDEGSTLFVRQDYEGAIRVFEGVLAEDPQNLMVTVRLAVAHSVLGNEGRAVQLFERAEQIHPGSIDRQHYLAMHYLRFRRWDLAGPLFERVLVAMPSRLPALEALARIREQEGRIEDAVRLLERVVTQKESPGAEWGRVGDLEMARGDTPAAIRAFEEAWSLQGEAFDRFLELGVCYLAAGRLDEAGEALDRVPSDHPGYGMALFKRAQVGVLLSEPDWRERARLAYERADAPTRRLIENERLFQGMAF